MIESNGTDRQDTVVLEVPRARRFRPLLHMVLGGIALRRELSFDALDDLQLAVDSILAGDKGSPEKTLTMKVCVGEQSLAILLEALRDPTLRATLNQGRVPAGSEDSCIDVCVLLRSLVDSYAVTDLDSDRFSLEMQKLVR
jgi:hypothetical protein